MTCSGRWVPAFSVFVEALGLAGPAKAQLVCNETAAVTPMLRHEGFTELVGNIELACFATPG